MGVGLARATETEVVADVVCRARSGVGGWVITPNLDILRRCVGDAEVRSLVGQADVRVADGMPLVWASRLAGLGGGKGLPERVAGSSLVWTVCEAAAREGVGVVLIGGSPGDADRAAGVLRGAYPGLDVKNVHCPAMGFESDAAAMGELEAIAGRSEGCVVFVGLGFPKQERLIERLRVVQPGAVWLGVGISFSYVAGTVKRAPGWARRLGLEWIYRLLQEPGRLARRYLVEGLPFAVRLGCWAAWRRFRGGRL